MVSIFVLVVFAVFGLLTFWLYRRLAVVPGWGRGVRRGVGVALIVGLALLVGGMLVEGGALDPRQWRWLAWAGMTYLAVLWYLAVGSAVIALVTLALRLARRRAAGRRVARAGAAVVGGGALLVTGYGLSEASMPSATSVTVSSPQLPAQFDGLRVAVVSDVHAGPIRDAGFVGRVVELVNDQRPDVVALAGDLVDGHVSQVGDVVGPFGLIEAPLGVWAVSGNHEFISGEPQAWFDAWEAVGVRLLGNSSTRLERGGASINLAGVHDESGGRFAPEYATDVAAALAQTDPEGFTLLAAHQPITAEQAQGWGVDLQVSGHTHAGQLWPFRYLVRLQQPVIDGLAEVAGTPVLTSRGAGAWGPPVRVLAPPEVPVITLRRG